MFICGANPLDVRCSNAIDMPVRCELSEPTITNDSTTMAYYQLRSSVHCTFTVLINHNDETCNRFTHQRQLWRQGVS
jgi:hypothetical protein